MSMFDSYQTFVNYIFTEKNWILQVFVIVLLTVVVDFIVKRILTGLQKGFEITKSLWDDALFNAAKKPLSLIIWLYGLGWAFEVVRAVSDAVIFDAVKPLKELGVILLLSWFLIRFVREIENNVLKQHLQDNEDDRLDEQTVHVMAKLVRLAIIITTGIVILQTLGYSISGVLAFGGIGGIAVGFAAKDLLANFFGVLMIYLDRPFSIGDWIRSPDKEIEGTVEYIGWRQTRIRTFDKRPLYIPNSTFAQISVENPSRMTNRRIFETIGVRYDDVGSLQTILEDIKTMLKEHKDIDTSQTLMVNFNAYSESSLDFFIYCFTKTTNWQRFHVIKEDILFKILAIIEENNAEVAYPTQVLNVSGFPDLNISEKLLDRNKIEETQ